MLEVLAGGERTNQGCLVAIGKRYTATSWWHLSDLGKWMSLLRKHDHTSRRSLWQNLRQLHATSGNFMQLHAASCSFPAQHLLGVASKKEDAVATHHCLAPSSHQVQPHQLHLTKTNDQCDAKDMLGVQAAQGLKTQLRWLYLMSADMVNNGGSLISLLFTNIYKACN